MIANKRGPRRSGTGALRIEWGRAQPFAARLLRKRRDDCGRSVSWIVGGMAILVGIATPQQFEAALAAVQKGPLPPATVERLAALREGFAGEAKVIAEIASCALPWRQAKSFQCALCRPGRAWWSDHVIPDRNALKDLTTDRLRSLVW
jgi:hypothetical protein